MSMSSFPSTKGDTNHHQGNDTSTSTLDPVDHIWNRPAPQQGHQLESDGLSCEDLDLSEYIEYNLTLLGQHNNNDWRRFFGQKPQAFSSGQDVNHSFLSCVLLRDENNDLVQTTEALVQSTLPAIEAMAQDIDDRPYAKPLSSSDSSYAKFKRPALGQIYSSPMEGIERETRDIISHVWQQQVYDEAFYLPGEHDLDHMSFGQC